MAPQTSIPLTVVVMARLLPGLTGGTGEAVANAVSALGRLTDGDERYVIVTDATAPDWLDAYIGPNTEIAVAPAHALSPGTRWHAHARRVLKPVLPALRSLRAVTRHECESARSMRWAVSPCDPFIESLRPDVVHFPYQWMHQTSAPSIFNPWDLQHVHHPEFFDAQQLAFRNHMYALWCQQATAVEVAAGATKHDLVTYTGIPAEKIVVVPRAALAQAVGPLNTDVLADVRQRYHLPDSFALYPAQTWPHKNHLRLFDALAQLRDRHDVTLTLVCPGRHAEFWPVLWQRIQELGLEQQVRAPGYIPSEHLRALYQLAEFTIFPTLFEGWGLPILEAFQLGSPLACSNLPVLVEQTGDAALLFDPALSDDIAATLLRLHRDGTLREQLRRRGAARARQYSWDRTVRTHRALYRKLAGHPLSPEDGRLLEAASAS